MRALIIALILFAVGAGLWYYFQPDVTPQPTYTALSAAPQETHSDVTVHFAKMGETVRVTMSHTPNDESSTLYAPFNTSMIGAGMTLDFVWDMTEIYRPDLYQSFDSICYEQNWVTVVNGRILTVEKTGSSSSDNCWVEFSVK